MIDEWVDLLQVDLLASGANLFWPRSGRPRATKSREVDLSRLKGLHLHFAPKMGRGVTRIWGFICESLTSMAECADSTPSKSIERVCVSPSSKEQICLLCAKVDEFRGPEKSKSLFQSRVNTGKGNFTPKESLTSVHILNLQRLFNTRISLPVTLTGSEKVS